MPARNAEPMMRRELPPPTPGMGRWARAVDEATAAAVHAAVPDAGEQTWRVLHGVAPVSGSDLAGKAGKYRSSYCRRYARALAKVRAAGITVQEMRGAHGARILLFGFPLPEGPQA